MRVPFPRSAFEVLRPYPSLGGRLAAFPYSHSIVLGGLELMSYTTRFTPCTSLMIRLDIRPNTSLGIFAQSAVMPSKLVTARNRHDILIGPLIAHHADRPDRQQNGERLPDVTIESGASDFLIYNCFRRAQDGQALFGDGAEHSNSQAGTGKRLPPDDLIGQSQFFPQHTHFVLEQFPQRLDQLQLHACRQSTDIVMGLDRR